VDARCLAAFGVNPGGRTFFFLKKGGTLCFDTTVVALFLIRLSGSAETSENVRGIYSSTVK